MVQCDVATYALQFEVVPRAIARLVLRRHATGSAC
jgi:hypothetical protein